MLRSAFLALALCLCGVSLGQDLAPLQVYKTGWLFDGVDVHGAAQVHVREGRITAVTAADAPLPAGATLHDLGAHSYLMPGLVLAHSQGVQRINPAVESLTATACSSDAWDPFADRKGLAATGFTSVVVSPGSQRFLPGHASVVRPFAAWDQQVLAAEPALTFVVTRAAYNPPAIYSPSVPPGPDNPVKAPERRFPRSRAGALTALRQVIEQSQNAFESLDLEGGQVDLRPVRALLSKTKVLRVQAELAADIRGVIRVARDYELDLVIVGGTEAWKVAKELGRIGAGVILRTGTSPFRSGPAPAGWPRPDGDPHADAPSLLAAAGVRVALIPSDESALTDTLWFAAQAKAKGFDESAVLRGLTSTAANLSGVGGRVGRVAAGWMADFVALDRHPLSAGANPLKVISGGEVVHDAAAKDEEGQGVTLIRAARVITNSGEELVPGEVLIVGSEIRAVGKGLAVPVGARVVDTAGTVVPGFVDLGAQVGLRRFQEDPSGELVLSVPIGPLGTDQSLHELFDPALPDVRSAAESGVTTLALTPRGSRGIGGIVSIVKTMPRDGDATVLQPRGGLFVDLGASAGGAMGIAALKKALSDGQKYKKAWDSYDEKKSEFDKAQAAAKKSATKESGAFESPELVVEKPRKPLRFHPVRGTWAGRISGLSEGGPVDLQLTLIDEGSGVSGRFAVKGALPYEGTVRGRWGKGRLTLRARFGQQRFTANLQILRNEVRGSWQSGPREGFLLARRTSMALPEAKPEAEAGEGEAEGGTKEKAEGKADPKAKAGESKKPSEKAEAKSAAKPEDKSAKKSDEKASSKDKSEAPKAPKANAAREIYRPLFESEIPILISVADLNVARQVLELCRGTYGLRTVLISSAPIEGLLPALSEHAAAFGPTAAALRRQKTDAEHPMRDAIAMGIPTGVWSGPLGDPRTVYDLAAYAVHRGLSREQALKMITTYPALILGVHDHVGSLKRGHDADLVILSGTPFDPSTRIERVMVDGRFLSESPRETQR